jgi:hypothetical protein
LFAKWRNAQRREIFSPIKADFYGRADARQKMQRRAAEKDPPFGRLDILQT